MKKKKTILKNLLPIGAILCLTSGLVATPFAIAGSIHRSSSSVNAQKLSIIQNIPSQLQIYSNQDLKLQVKTNAQLNQTVQYHWYCLAPEHFYNQQWTQLTDQNTNTLIITYQEVLQYNQCEFKCLISDQNNHTLTSHVTFVTVTDVDFQIQVPSKVYLNENGYCQIKATINQNADLTHDQLEYNWYEINKLNQKHLIQSSFTNLLLVQAQKDTTGFVCLIKDLTTNYKKSSRVIQLVTQTPKFL